jgi:hypothetical protein
MMMRKTAVVVALVLTLGVSVAACSGDGGSAGTSGGTAAAVELKGNDKDAATAVGAALAANSMLPANATDAQRSCTATRYVRAFGAAKALQAAAATTVSATDAQTIYEILDACIDIRSALVHVLAADGEMGPTSARCLVDKLAPADLKAAWIADLTGNDSGGDISAAVLVNQAACLSAEELSRMN